MHPRLMECTKSSSSTLESLNWATFLQVTDPFFVKKGEQTHLALGAFVSGSEQPDLDLKASS